MSGLDPTNDMHCQCEKESLSSRNVIWDDPVKGGEIGQCDKDQVTHTQRSDTPQIILPHASAMDKKSNVRALILTLSGQQYTHKEHFLSPASQLVTVDLDWPFSRRRKLQKVHNNTGFRHSYQSYYC